MEECKFNIGDKVVYINKKNGADIFTVKTIEVDTDDDSYMIHYEEGSYDSEVDLELYKEPIKEDVVVSPAHYTTTKISALQVVDDWDLGFYLGNTLKYMKRYKLKGSPITDLKKAQQYIQLLIDKLEEESK